MQRIRQEELPKDYDYYRSHSETYFSWIAHNARKNGAVAVREGGFFGLVNRLFGGIFSVAVFEKSDFVPDSETLRKYGFKRGLVVWSGWRKERPGSGGWHKLPYVIGRTYVHSTRSAFSVADTPEYWKKWSPGPRGHRNKIRKLVESGEIVIDTGASLEDFLAAYEKTKLPHGWKRYLVNRQKFLSGLKDGKIRIYLASVNGEALAGAVFLDDSPTSTYLVAFQDAKGKRHHLGLAIVDRWFEESAAKGFKYLDFDHMRDVLDSPSYQGYTDFKTGIADYDVRFPNVWFKFFR